MIQKTARPSPHELQHRMWSDHVLEANMPSVTPHNHQQIYVLTLSLSTS